MPIVDLKTQSVVGYEALARWIRLDGNVVYPDGFLPVAESSDIILDLDAAILRQACQALTVISHEQHIAVNLSPVTLALADVPGLVRAALEEFGVEPTRLHLEVTETSIVTVTDAIVAAMHEVSDMGVCWWIDDFGTGFSSLSHLRDLPIDGIKLDRGFVSAISGNGEEAGRSYRLAQGILGLAQGLGLQTVAEGVEDQGQAEVLTKQGWQLGQGWLYGKARPVTDLTPSLQ
jgi:EAL domain-containing protein (putative c-di-GMP-specific phosphodiesterase class I)